MPLTISDNIFSKCATAMTTNIESCGALTACDISPTTSAELDAIYKDAKGQWRIGDALLQYDFIIRACQARQNGMFDWLMATKRDYSKKITLSPLSRGMYEVFPFVKGKRKGIINNEYWNVTAGTVAGGTAPNGNAYDYRCTVTSQTGVPKDLRWFADRDRVTIVGMTNAGSKTLSSWKVVDRELTAGNSMILFLETQNTASNFPASKLVPPGGAGVNAAGWLVRGTPIVNDFEKWCEQIPGINTTQMTPFWIETTRNALCQDDQVNKFLDQIRLGNKYFATFADVPGVELNAQMTADWQRRVVNSFFFNKALPNQTMGDWDKLKKITAFSDDANGNYLSLPFEGSCVGREAAAVGIYEQFQECNRVLDLQGQVMNIPELAVQLYQMLRVRKETGSGIKTGPYGPIIELGMDSFFATQFSQAMLRYFKYKSEGLLRLNMDLSAKKSDGPMGFFFQSFAMDYPHCEIRIVTSDFFDDYVTAAKTAGASLEAAGRFIAILDWSGIYYGQVDSNTVTNVSGNIQEIAKVNQDAMCVMRIPKRSMKLTSMTGTNVVECGAANLWLENFSVEIPEHQEKVGNYGDVYGDMLSNNP